MKKIIFVFMVSILFFGCSNSNNSINISNTDSDISGNTYNYYGYNLKLSEDMKSKLYTWVSGESNLKSFEELYTVEGKVNNERFVISDKTTPVYFKNFDKKAEVLKIKFKPIDSTSKFFKNGAKDGKTFESTLLGGGLSTVFNTFKERKFGEAITLAYYEDNKNGLKIDLLKYSKNDNGEYIIDNPFKSNKIQKLELEVLELITTHKDKSKHYFYNSDEVSYYIKDFGIENDIVRENLINIPNNEELIRIVAKNDSSFFRTLQHERTKYNLDSKSILLLPDDVNIEYALNNLNEIINTSEYLATNNTFKKINDITTIFSDVKNTKSITDTESNYKYKPTIDRNKIENKSKQVDISNKNFKENNIRKSEFVDLDNGI